MLFYIWSYYLSKYFNILITSFNVLKALNKYSFYIYTFIYNFLSCNYIYSDFIKLAKINFNFKSQLLLFSIKLKSCVSSKI